VRQRLPRTAGAALLALLAVVMLSAPRQAAAAQGDDSCGHVIAALPADVFAAGTWCLDHDLSSGAAGTLVNIIADNVVLDCNGHAITGTAGAGGTTFGLAGSDRRNIVVRNCRISGFMYGIYLVGHAGGGHLVEDNLLSGNYYAGMYVVGDGSTVRRNRVFDSGGSTVSVSAFGIEVGDSVEVLDNTVVNVAASPGGGTYGINGSCGGGSGNVSGNRVRGVDRDGANSGYGINVDSYASLVLRDNDLVVGANGGTGMACSSNAGNRARARDNVFSGWPTAMQSCANGNGNVVRP
jgi:parallel beta-helix repeat protein